MIRKLIRKLLGDNLTDDNSHLASVNFVIVLLMFIISAVLLAFLPDAIPMQWQMDGTVSYTLPSYIGVWAIPIIGLAVNLSLIRQNRLSIASTVGIGILGAAMSGLYAFIIIMY